MQNAVIIIKGKGAKERLIHICDKHVITALDKYRSEYDTEIHSCGYFFVNSIGNRLSDQSVREMINKYCHIADIQQHITPHMFRHSFATLAGSGIFSIIASFNYMETYLEHFVLNKPLQDMDYYMKYVCWDSIVTRYLEELIYPNISE